MSKELYWCDWCFNKKLDVNSNELFNTFFGCTTQQQYVRHLQTNKHIKSCLEGGIEEGIKCKYCNKMFSAEGYEVHCKRNESLWKLQRCGGYKQLKCNNFSSGCKRYESFEQYLIDNDPNKPKQHRTKIGQISPITNQPRKKNGSSNSSSMGVDDSDQSDNEVEEPIKENLCERLNDGLHLTIEEIEVDEKPQFEDYCVNCYKPINYEDLGISANILDKFDIITCFCSDSD